MVSASDAMVLAFDDAEGTFEIRDVATTQFENLNVVVAITDR